MPCISPCYFFSMMVVSKGQGYISSWQPNLVQPNLVISKSLPCDTGLGSTETAGGLKGEAWYCERPLVKMQPRFQWRPKHIGDSRTSV